MATRRRHSSPRWPRFTSSIPVGHVEAGLRTTTVKLPFPEELNRRLTDLVAEHYYCPTPGAAANLRG